MKPITEPMARMDQPNIESPAPSQLASQITCLDNEKLLALLKQSKDLVGTLKYEALDDLTEAERERRRCLTKQAEEQLNALQHAYSLRRLNHSALACEKIRTSIEAGPTPAAPAAPAAAEPKPTSAAPTQSTKARWWHHLLRVSK